jgi:hypothetical protein
MLTLAEVLNGELPWWASAFAAVLLALAAAIARRITRRSARPQGERLGTLERLVESERTRRRQVEAQLVDLGVPLPYWPPDGPNQPRPSRREDVEDLADEDDRDRWPMTTEAPRPPLPPMQSRSRH